MTLTRAYYKRSMNRPEFPHRGISLVAITHHAVTNAFFFFSTPSIARGFPFDQTAVGDIMTLERDSSIRLNCQPRVFVMYFWLMK